MVHFGIVRDVACAELCIATHPRHAARLDFSRNIPDGKLQHTSQQPLHSHSLGSLFDMNKTLIRRILFSEAVFCLQFSPN